MYSSFYYDCMYFLCFIFIISIFNRYDFYTVSINIISILSTFYTLTFIFKFDKENITDFMTKYTESIKSYNKCK